MPTERKNCRLQHGILPSHWGPGRLLVSLVLLLLFIGQPIARCHQRPPPPEDESRVRAIETAEYAAGLVRRVESAEGRIRGLAALGQTFWTLDRSRAVGYFKAVAAIPKERSQGARLTATAARKPQEEAALARLMNRAQMELMHRLLPLDPLLYEELIGLIRQLKSDDPNEGSEKNAYSEWSQICTLVETDPQLAATLAERRLSIGTLFLFSEFLLALRACEPGLADGLFQKAVGLVLASRPADLKALLLLSSYILRDQLDFTTPVNAQITRLFLQALFDALTSATANNLTNHILHENDEILMRYLPIVRFLPLFEQYLPEAIPRLGQLLEALAGSLSEETQGKVDQLNARRLSTDPIASLLAQSQHLTGGNRDALYSHAAVQSAARGEFERAQQIARQIESEPLRQKILDDLLLLTARQYLEAGEFEKARIYAQQLKNVVDRSELLIRIGQGLIKLKQPELASSVLVEAFTLIERKEPSGEKARMLTALIKTLVEINTGQAFEAVQVLITTLNRLPDQSTSARSPATVRSEWKSEQDLVPMVETLFQRLGSADFDRALDFSAGIADTEVRALTELAACRAVLNRTGRAIILEKQ